MRTLTKAVARTMCALAVACVAAGSATAAESDARVIRARAGGVNYVGGDVSFRRAGAADWQPLTKHDDLRGGDSVRTGADGRAEILLNPGSYLRLAPDSEFELTDASLAGLRLRIARGSAVVEAMGYGDEGFSIAVSTPHAEARIVRTGVYRFNAVESSEVVVQKGRAVLTKPAAGELKEGRAARVSRAGGLELAKWDKKGRDEFDEWSRGRAEELARVNRKIQRRSVNSAVARADFDHLFGMGDFASPGVWMFDPTFDCYTFLPFLYGWGSPYGFHYSSHFWVRNCLPCRRLPGYRAYERMEANLSTPIFRDQPVGSGGRTGYGADYNAAKPVSSAPVDSKHAGAGGGGAAAVGAKGTSPKN